ncbi:hypothetical protein H4N54_09740 [Limnospira fusiformis KN01]|nr:hypothetical protein [Limnospira fusiformis]ULB48262.1 hypothetical protein H4N54_09740 [Limnospira fusiformis KN01]
MFAFHDPETRKLTQFTLFGYN